MLLVSAAFAAKKKPPLHPINLNIATATELQQVPGIGPATADKTIKMRKSYGPFKRVDDLRHQEYRSETYGKNAQIFDGRQGSRAEESALCSSGPGRKQNAYGFAQA